MTPTATCQGCGEPMVIGRCLPGQRQHCAHGLCHPCYWRTRHRREARSAYRPGPIGDRAETRARDAQIAAWTRAGYSAMDIARMLRTTRRTVFRARARSARIELSAAR